MPTPAKALYPLIVAAATTAPPVWSQASTAQDSLTQQVDALFAEWDKPTSPGCALGVIRDGSLIYKRGYGMANLENSVPISPSTVFLIGSTSKQFAAASILLAEDQGYLSLDDDIRTYLPEMPDYGDPITIRHLMYHTSGIREYYALSTLAGEYPGADVVTNEQIIAFLARQKGLNFRPGTENAYATTNYVLLGEIVERATGKSLREFAEENIFRPLGMTHTHFHDDRFHIVKNRANSYSLRGEGEFAFAWSSNYATVGNTGLYTTVEDLLLWDQNLYENRLARPDLADRLVTPGMLTDGAELHYAAGLKVGHYRGVRHISHDGGTMGFRANFVQFPDLRFSIICLCNVRSTNPNQLTGQVAELYLADEFEPDMLPVEPVEVSEPTLREMAGAYRDPDTGDILEFFAEEGSLVFHREDGSTTGLEPLSATHFRLPRGLPYRHEYEFYRPDSSAPWQVKITARFYPPDTELLFWYEPVELVAPTETQLRDYVGEYRNDELPATYSVSIDNGRLVATLPRFGAVSLEPTILDHFQLSWWGYYFEFTRGEEGRIVGFDLRSSRLRDVRFVRQPIPPN
jgi:CubicO group peptidase (beta-lactamase class C family)